MKTFFITGTDTEVGKTYVTCNLIKYFNQLGYRTAAMKPIASGCKYDAGKLVNDDAFQLQNIASEYVDYAIVNPFVFEPAIAPHIAANMVNHSLCSERVFEKIQQFLSYESDFLLIEGAGGWQLPLNHKEVLADVVARLKLPVILVVGLKLGCLNHAILTAQSIRQSGCQLVGFITNEVNKPMPYQSENIQTLVEMIDAPYLAHLAYQKDKFQLNLLDELLFDRSFA
ncbi:dethiobiotin synthase [Thiotrichales bacterium 19S11-10]|nr:dethiobiotin synthase [Thiotrichales bacterium 19S11-10]